MLHSAWHEARDGMRLATYVLQPDPAVHGPPPYPTVVYIHGGPWTGLGGHFHPHLYHFALEGYAVVATDFRGSLGYGLAHCEAWRGELSTGMIEDVLAGLHEAYRLGFGERTALAFGWSYGGLAASILATQHPDRIRGAVAVAGPSGGLSDGSRQWHWLSEARDMRTTPRRHLDTLIRPLLQIHGAEDDVVDVAATENTARTAEKGATERYAAVRVPGLDHSGDKAQQLFVLALADHWFARCLDRSVGAAPEGVEWVEVLVDGPGWLGR
ncbi:MAG: dipeptidyl aminopeptidase/acylaminoacyl peptidase [Myxococcota bacterium]